MKAIRLLALLTCVFAMAHGQHRALAAVAVVMAVDAAVLVMGWGLPRAGARWTIAGLCLALLVWLGFASTSETVAMGLLLGTCWFSLSRLASERSLSVFAALVLAVHIGHGPWSVLAWLAATGWILGLPGALHGIYEARESSRTSPVGIGPGQALAFCAASAALSLSFWEAVSPSWDAGSVVGISGFSDEVRLGRLAPMLSDDREVIRISVEDTEGRVPERLYVRGAVLDRFDGRRWQATWPLVTVDDPAVLPDDALRMVVEQASRPGGVLFSAGHVLSVQGVDGVRRDAAGNWRASRTGPVEFTLWTRFGDRSDEVLGAGESARYLLVPEDLSMRVREISDGLTAEHPGELGRETTALVQGMARYSRDFVPDQQDDPLEAFLFNSRRGHCEYFASSVALLMRLRGVPTRVVHGFLLDRAPENQSWSVRASDAHSWVEYHDGRSWQLLDPTPASREPAAETRRASGAMAGPLGLHVDVHSSVGTVRLRGIVGLGLLACVVWLARRLGLRSAAPGSSRQGVRGRVARAWNAAHRGATRRWGSPPDSLPPLSAARWLASQGCPARAELEALAWLHYRVQYGGEDDTALAPEAEELASRALAHERR